MLQCRMHQLFHTTLKLCFYAGVHPAPKAVVLLEYIQKNWIHYYEPNAVSDVNYMVWFRRHATMLVSKCMTCFIKILQSDLRIWIFIEKANWQTFRKQYRNCPLWNFFSILMSWIIPSSLPYSLQDTCIQK